MNDCAIKKLKFLAALLLALTPLGGSTRATTTAAVDHNDANGAILHDPHELKNLVTEEKY